MFLERADASLPARRHAIVLFDRPSGDRKSEAKFLTETLTDLRTGTSYAKAGFRSHDENASIDGRAQQTPGLDEDRSPTPPRADASFPMDASASSEPGRTVGARPKR